MASVSHAAMVPLATLLACGSSEQPGLPSDVTWTSEHFRYHTRKADPSACAATLETLERHFARSRDYLGFAWPEGAKVDYYKFRDAEDYTKTGACTGSAGCAPASAVLSPVAFHRHELIHAYLSHSGRPPDVFVEGVAETMDCVAPAIVPIGIDWRDVLAFDGGGHQGPGVGWFAGYFLNAYGPLPFMQLYRTLAQDADVDGIAAALEAVYGESVERLWPAALADDDPRIGCVASWECGQPAVPINGSEVVNGDACSGGVSGGTFHLDSPADVIWSVSGGQTPRFGGCGDHLAPSIGTAYWTSGRGGQTLAHLSAGDYYVMREGTGIERLSVRLDSAVRIGTDCSVVEPWVVAADDNRRLSFVVPQDGTTWFTRLRFELSTERTIALQDYLESPAAEARVCSSCDTMGAACTVIRAGQSQVLTLGGDAVVAVSASPRADRFTVVDVR